jgi:hypothetical protein
MELAVYGKGGIGKLPYCGGYRTQIEQPLYQKDSSFAGWRLVNQG